MPPALTFAEAALVCALALVVLAVLLVYLRRQVIARGRAPFMCGLKLQGQDRFAPGMASLDGTSLEWFRLNGLWVAPTRSWRRNALEVSPAEPVDAPELSSIMVRPLVVRCRFGEQRFELAVPDACYMALRSWVESMPPGHNVNVA